MTFTQKIIALRTIFLKEILRFSRIWVQTIVPSIITVALYFIIFGNLIGSQLNDVKGHAYIDYIIPGMIMMSIITNSYANVVSSFYSSKFQKHIEEMLVSPMPNYIIIWGFLSGGIARGVMVGVAVSLTATFFTDLQFQNIGLLCLVTLLTCILFSLAGLINAIFANSFDDISLIPTFVLTPLTYLGGIFYSIDMLPEFWRSVSYANPILYMVDTFRLAMIGVNDINIYLSLTIISVFVLALYIAASTLLNKGIGVRS
ncbi:MAG: ABC transporter permease [Gammaproteobacteria bacterium]|nr:ABC transporter permease [Gammaproteobacteria bacterium]